MEGKKNLLKWINILWCDELEKQHPFSLMLIIWKLKLKGFNLMRLHPWHSMRICYTYRKPKWCTQHPFSRRNLPHPTHFYINCHLLQCNPYPLHLQCSGKVEKKSGIEENKIKNQACTLQVQYIIIKGEKKVQFLKRF